MHARACARTRVHARNHARTNACARTRTCTRARENERVPARVRARAPRVQARSGGTGSCIDRRSGQRRRKLRAAPPATADPPVTRCCTATSCVATRCTVSQRVATARKRAVRPASAAQHGASYAVTLQYRAATQQVASVLCCCTLRTVSQRDLCCKTPRNVVLCRSVLQRALRSDACSAAQPHHLPPPLETTVQGEARPYALSAPTCLSARRHTERHTCSAALLRPPAAANENIT